MTEAAPAVTEHARLKSEIQQAFQRGREAVVNGHDARLDPVTGVALILQGDAIVTVFEPTDQQIERVSAR